MIGRLKTNVRIRTMTPDQNKICGRFVEQLLFELSFHYYFFSLLEIIFWK